MARSQGAAGPQEHHAGGAAALQPDLNPVERVWLDLRERYLSHRLLQDYEAVVDACCTAWNKLTAEAGRLPSLSAFPYLAKISS